MFKSVVFFISRSVFQNLREVLKRPPSPLSFCFMSWMVIKIPFEIKNMVDMKKKVFLKCLLSLRKFKIVIFFFFK